jgi:MSHA biogenesis protein MshN
VVKELKPLTPAQEAEALWLQGAALVEKGRSSEAQALLEQCLQRHPAHLKARQTLVMLALEAGRRAEAENLLRQGISLHPGMVWFPRSLAQLYLQQGDYAQAASVLKDGLGRQAEAEDWALYASTLAKLNQPEDTATAYREALRRDPSQGAWWIGLGVALEQGGHAAEARAAYQRALQSRLGPELRDFAAAKLKE